MRIRSLVVLAATLSVVVGTPAGSADAVPPPHANPSPCPRSMDLMTLEQLEAFVEAAGGQTGPALTAFFEFIDENGDGVGCFKTLPEATQLPTPPLLGTDNR
jgi:hypothetical protein